MYISVGGWWTVITVITQCVHCYIPKCLKDQPRIFVITSIQFSFKDLTCLNCDKTETKSYNAR